MFPIFSRFCYASYICLKFPILHPKILYFSKSWFFNFELKFHIKMTNRGYIQDINADTSIVFSWSCIATYAYSHGRGREHHWKLFEPRLFLLFSDNLAVGFFHHRLTFLSDSNAGTNKFYIFRQYMYIVCDKLLLSPIRIKQRTTINVPYLLSQNIK